LADKKPDWLATILSKLGKHSKSVVDLGNSKDRRTGLHITSFKGDIPNTLLLLKHGADTRATNLPWEQNPIHVACQKGHSNVVAELVLFDRYHYPPTRYSVL